MWCSRSPVRTTKSGVDDLTPSVAFTNFDELTVLGPDADVIAWRDKAVFDLRDLDASPGKSSSYRRNEPNCSFVRR